MAAEKKKARLEVFPLPMGATSGKTEAEIEKAYKEAIRAHPFHDNCHSVVDVYEDCVLRDGKGTILGVLIRQALPLQVREMAAKVLRPAATKTTLRSSIFGGEAPQSGVAGYFDYRGSPIGFKYRKTAFTHEHINEWPAVFPMVDYVSEIYRRTMPEQWQRQMDAIPDVVRIHNSPFSTLTINSQFRTASHTDAGDFDDGYGCLASLEGDYQGLHLTFDNFHVNYVIRPGDVLVFNTHHFHSNTELELLDNRKWSRLTCVFYYRASLGEPAGYSEYRRRLLNAKQVKKATLFQTIVEKPNGVNLNRAAEVHPISLTPFGLLEAIGNMCHCRPKSRIVHQWLLDVHEATEAGRPEELLFGEVLVNLDGLPARHADDIVRVHSPSYFYKAPAMGGFKDFDEIPAPIAEKANFFLVENLSEYINSELVDLWADARCQWLGKVKEEWESMVKRSANRESFMWNNRSDLTSTFFEACEVAKAVFLDLREKESAIPQQEETFWTLFAYHLHRATVTELRMPETAITLKKLNVKLKDFNFGGTRYFKDMDDIEQQRRLDRRQRIEEARRAGGAQNRVKQPSEWAKNDTFDYQTEDCVVDYTSLGFATPAENADRAVDVALYCKCANPNAIPDVVEILIVFPRPSAPPRRTTAPAKRTSREPCGAEYSRIMENPAALRILHGSTADGSCVVNDPGASLPPPTIFKKGRLQIHYAYADELPTRRFHFTILQHALIGQPDPEAAKAMIEKCRSFTRGCVFVLESELWCRQHYTIHSTIREAYAEVAEGCYQDLLRARYGVRDAVVRTRPQLRELVPDLSAIYKLRGSPLNSLILLCSTQREENTERQ